MFGTGDSGEGSFLIETWSYKDANSYQAYHTGHLSKSKLSSVDI